MTRRAEEALLGAMLFRPEALPGMRWVPAGAFSSPDLGALWTTLQNIDFRIVPANEVASAVTAAVARIEDQGLRQCLTPSRLSQLASACPDPRTAPLYGGMTVESAIHRSVEHAGNELRNTAQQSEVDQAAQALAQVERTGNRLAALDAAWKTAPETVRNLLDTPAEEPIQLAQRTTRARVDLQAEAETVASLLSRPEQLPEVTGWLQSRDFSDPQLVAVYEAMTTLHDRHAPIDTVTVAWEAARRPGAQPSGQVLDELERGGMGGTAAYTGEQVLGTAVLDRLDATGHHMRDLALHPQLAPTALVGHAEQTLQPVLEDGQRLHHAEREPELAPGDKEPAPATPTSHEVTAPDHEMEI
ncbi:DNA helicase [Streptomyces sp. NBC_01728]|uniref:DnaB-like helicase N-terminal domain-containing protein n=1 Tax=unclassified Streptomyces TaxID=2593676 RepID=UPI0022533F60|nr:MULTISPECIES: DnaB-like helicase N-terminal domain-containing protein [unclassified Streptomyces]MCX4462417.1 DNA helicase [Streptomyces sp. NBC_01719]MCX4500847.1 DNA helicase [Streptomyces sp. NBC_01728]